jgi:hypothetical protein
MTTMAGRRVQFNIERLAPSREDGDPSGAGSGGTV